MRLLSLSLISLVCHKVSKMLRFDTKKKMRLVQLHLFILLYFTNALISASDAATSLESSHTHNGTQFASCLVPVRRTAIHEPSASVWFQNIALFEEFVKFVTVPSAAVAVWALKSSTTVTWALRFYLLEHERSMILICSSTINTQKQ